MDGAAIAFSVATASTAFIAGAAYVWSTYEMADAQRDVAETNARATIQAAREAAMAQIESAKYDAKARMHDADMAYKQENEYIQSEKWFATRDLDNKTHQKERWQELDDIRIDYATVEGSWGLNSSSHYDYGFEPLQMKQSVTF